MITSIWKLFSNLSRTCFGNNFGLLLVDSCSKEIFEKTSEIESFDILPEVKSSSAPTFECLFTLQLFQENEMLAVKKFGAFLQCVPNMH